MHLSVTEIVHDLVRTHLKPGDTAFDGTAGNGHDTLFLAQCVGPTGRVLAWDIQPLAIERTAALLAKYGISWVELKLGDHAEFETLLPRVSDWPVRCGDTFFNVSEKLFRHDLSDTLRNVSPQFAAAIFNLGYLPASDRTISTTTTQSLRAISASVERLAPGGILTVLAYTGHAGGREEAEAIHNFLRGMSFGDFHLDEVPIPGGRSSPPRLFALVRRLLL